MSSMPHSDEAQAFALPEEAESFPCHACGGQLRYEPGTSGMQCPNCATRVSITPSEMAVEKLDLARHSNGSDDETLTTEAGTVACTGCGAQLSLPAHVTALSCAFCATPLVVTQTQRQRLIKPQALLPFEISSKTAQAGFRDWLNGLWFAPNALKKLARQEGGLQGIYIPYWVYDCDTETQYRGSCGRDRQETYSDSNGKIQRRTVTDWYPASGNVGKRFDDVLTVASHSLDREYAEELEPWDLEQLIPYQAQYLSGFAAEAYQLSLADGFAYACERMRAPIESAVRWDIGGDHQRIADLQTRYFNTTFKHMLLPIWISAYRFEGKVFKFIVNARTGEVQGERPWSIWKIGSLVLLVLAVLAWFILTQ